MGPEQPTKLNPMVRVPRGQPATVKAKKKGFFRRNQNELGMTTVQQLLLLSKNWTSVYPLYLDRSKTCDEGRLVSLQYAVDRPNINDIANACRKLGIEYLVDPVKRHPRDQIAQESGMPTGRVKVNFFAKEHGGSTKRPLQEIAQAPFKPATVQAKNLSSPPPTSTGEEQGVKEVLEEQPVTANIANKKQLLTRIAHTISTMDRVQNAKESKKEEKHKIKEEKKKEKREKKIKIKGLK